MAVRSKTGTAPLQHQPGKPKELGRVLESGQSQATAGSSVAAKVAKIQK
jgi:hypothetical protein